MELVEEIDIGDHVECDLCSKHFTTSDETGGFLFESKGVGPCCAERFLAEVQKCGEEEYIRDRARDGEKFREAVMRWRGGNNKVRQWSGTIEELFGALPSKTEGNENA